jgi:hypothetical protein
MEVRTNRLTEKKEQDADPDYPGLLRLSGVVLATPSSQTWSQDALPLFPGKLSLLLQIRNILTHYFFRRANFFIERIGRTFGRKLFKTLGITKSGNHVVPT